MTVRQRWWLGAIFFALMFGHTGVMAYSAWLNLRGLAGSYDGWGARLLPDGRAEIATVDQKGPATVLQPGDEFVAINGLTLKDDPQIRNYNRRVPSGTRYVMTVRRQGQLREFALMTTSYPVSRWLVPIADILVQLLFLLTGLMVFVLKPADRQAWLLALMLGAFTGLFNNNLPPLPLAVLLMAGAARIVGLLFLPVFCHFFLIFPDRSPLLRRFPRLEWWLYLPFFLILPWFATTRFLTIFRAHEQWAEFFRSFRLLKYQWIASGSLLLALGYLVCGMLALFIGYRIAGIANRRKLHVIAAGSGAGVLNLLVLIVWETFFRARFPQAGDWMEIGLKFTLPLIPLSFAYAIIRHQVIPVSLIIRRGVRYVLVSRGSVLLEGIAVTLTVTALLTYVFSRLKPTGLTIGIVSAAVGIATWKLASRLHDKYLAPVIDRRFFRESYNSHQIIAELTNELRTVTGLPQLVELVSTKIQSALKTENVTIFLRDKQTADYLSEYSCEYQAGSNKPVVSDQIFRIPHYASVIESLSDAESAIEIEDGTPLLTKSSGNESAAVERETLRQVKSTLLLPLTTKDGLGGMISLGPRLGDLPYSRDDKQLLVSVAGPTTFAIENAHLVERMLEDARRRQELEAENELRARELEEARQLQLSMLPKIVPQLPHIEIAAYMKTAAEVGGDYYDFHLADDGTLTIAVGDATGHGLKAGTMVTAAKSLFNNLAHSADITDIFRQSSRTLKGMNLRALFMAMTLLRISANRMTVSVAGMPPVLIHRALTGTIEEAALKGLPLGSMRDYQWRQQDFDLLPGDVVVAMSDGFPELFNDGGEMFGYEQASAALVEVAACTPTQIVEHFVRAAVRWADGRPQDDDVTFVVLKVR
jgi:serine phosphatase RsbU (regulator of sigma subunit)